MGIFVLKALCYPASMSADLVMIEWEDSRQPEPGWVRLTDFQPDKACLCVSVGFLVHDGDETKALAPNMADIEGDNMQASGIIYIPTRCVKRIVPLEESTSSPSGSAPASEQMRRRS